MKALIIDDDPIIVMLVSSMLSAKGYEVLSVSSEKGVGEIPDSVRKEFDLFLIDLQLGLDSGYSIYENYLKASASLDKVIFMSANSPRDAIELYHLPDEAKFLGKPFKAPDLYNLIY